MCWIPWCPDQVPTVGEVIITLKRSLEREESSLIQKTSNRYNLRDLSRTFSELDRVAEDVVRAKYGSLEHRHEFEQARLFPVLERVMEKTHRTIIQRLTPRMSKLYPWLVCFDVSMPQEVFNLFLKTILGAFPVF